MNDTDELGYTTRALFRYNQKHNELGQKVEDGDMDIADFNSWRDGTYEPERKAMVARNLAVKARVMAAGYPDGGQVSDFSGGVLTKPEGIKTASKKEAYAYALKLKEDHKPTEMDAVATEVSDTFIACELDTAFDTEIEASDEFKKL